MCVRQYTLTLELVFLPKPPTASSHPYLTLMVPFMPLPSSWKVLRLPDCSSVCSLPEEATLLWGERGACSPLGMKAGRAPISSTLIHSPGTCWLVGMRDMERFRGLGWIWQGRAAEREKERRGH